MGRWTKRIVGAGLVGGAAYTLWRIYRSSVASGPEGPTWEAAPFPFPPVPSTRSTTADPAQPAPATGSPTGGHTQIPAGMEPGGGPETDDGVAGIEPWMEPIDGQCPLSHPVKAKLSSGIFHVPGGQSYDRTKPDRCYVDSAAAEADGLRPSQR